MLPMATFQSLLRDDKSFQIKFAHSSNKMPYKQNRITVSADEGGLVLATWPDGQRLAGNAFDILARLNALILQPAPFEAVSTSARPDTWYGHIAKFWVTPGSEIMGKGRSTFITSELVTGGTWFDGDDVILKVNVKGQQTTYLGMHLYRDDAFAEIAEFSMDTIPLHWHKKMVSHGHEWKSFHARYGEDTLRKLYAHLDMCHLEELPVGGWTTQRAVNLGRECLKTWEHYGKTLTDRYVMKQQRLMANIPPDAPLPAPPKPLVALEKLIFTKTVYRPTEPPKYPQRTYQASSEELEPFGVSSVDEMVTKMNAFLATRNDIITAGDFPTSKGTFRSLCVRWKKLGLTYDEPMEAPYTRGM